MYKLFGMLMVIAMLIIPISAYAVHNSIIVDDVGFWPTWDATEPIEFGPHTNITLSLNFTNNGHTDLTGVSWKFKNMDLEGNPNFKNGGGVSILEGETVTIIAYQNIGASPIFNEGVLNNIKAKVTWEDGNDSKHKNMDVENATIPVVRIIKPKTHDGIANGTSGDFYSFKILNNVQSQRNSDWFAWVELDQDSWDNSTGTPTLFEAFSGLFYRDAWFVPHDAGAGWKHEYHNDYGFGNHTLKGIICDQAGNCGSSIKMFTPTDSNMWNKTIPYEATFET